MDLKEGTSLTGICDVTGNPFPHSFWQKDGFIIDPANPLKRTSAGMYNIIVNMNIQKSLMVNVICKSIFMFKICVKKQLWHIVCKELNTCYRKIITAVVI